MRKTLEVLVSFEKTLRENRDKLSKVHRNEVTLLEARIYEELEENDKAIEIFTDKAQLIVEKIKKYEGLARIYLKIG